MKNKSSNINMDKDLKILETIQKVETPPFLYTRIQSGIQEQNKETVPAKWSWMAAVFLMLIFAFNFTVIQINRKNSTPDLAEIFSLKSQIILYDE